MRTKGIIWMGFLAIALACSDPEPVYHEGEILWQVGDGSWYMGIPDMQAILTPDGNQLFYTYSAGQESSDRYQLNRVDIADGTESLVGPYSYNLDISPDGQWLLFNGANMVPYKSKLNGDSLSRLPLPMRTWTEALSWGPDSKTIAYISGSRLQVLTGDNEVISVAPFQDDPDFFPDGRRIITVEDDPDRTGSRFAIHDWVTGKSLAKLNPSPGQTNRNPQVSPDGNRILYTNNQGIYIVNTDGSRVLKVLPSTYFYENKRSNHIGFVASGASWHPDSHHIIYSHLAVTAFYPCDICLDSYRGRAEGSLSVRKVRVPGQH